MQTQRLLLILFLTNKILSRNRIEGALNQHIKVEVRAIIIIKVAINSDCPE